MVVSRRVITTLLYQNEKTEGVLILHYHDCAGYEGQAVTGPVKVHQGQLSTVSATRPLDH